MCFQNGTHDGVHFPHFPIDFHVSNELVSHENFNQFPDILGNSQEFVVIFWTKGFFSISRHANGKKFYNRRPFIIDELK